VSATLRTKISLWNDPEATTTGISRLLPTALTWAMAGAVATTAAINVNALESRTKNKDVLPGCTIAIVNLLREWTSPKINVALSGVRPIPELNSSANPSR
jgi:hypothetical protein